MKTAGTIGVFSILLGGCAATPLAVYQDERPALDLARYFDGEVQAWGMFQDRFGKVVKRFTVRIQTSWKDDVGTLQEDFLYADGSVSRRVWTVRKLDAHSYRATAADVVGEAKGAARGNALRWRYVLALEVGGRTYNVKFDDWVYLIDDDVLLNRSVMSKFGVRLGEVTLAFRRKP